MFFKRYHKSDHYSITTVYRIDLAEIHTGEADIDWWTTTPGGTISSSGSFSGYFVVHNFRVRDFCDIC